MSGNYNQAAKPPKTYINGIFIREKVFDDGGSLLRLGIHVDKLCEQLRDLAGTEEFINLTITRLKQPNSKNGTTHNCTLDTFKPKQSSGKPAGNANQGNDDIPFN